MKQSLFCRVVAAIAVILPLIAVAPSGHASSMSSSEAGNDPGADAQARTRSARTQDSLRTRRNWGVDIEGVRVVSSGYMLAFRYRVLDAAKAAALTERTSRPYLTDEATGIVMSVPVMEKVGELRQSVPPEEGRSYFMVFGNPGKTVKRGSRVSVAIGNFRIGGLVVQ